MSPERKIERINELFRGLDVAEMTTLELQVHEVLTDQEAMPEQKEASKRNSAAVMD